MNKLIHETSPYLLQHAHNPVEWYAWKPEAFERAKAENKPILVSIGYSTCHWCHVMERESFEDTDTAALMNRYFINIKVDREERPDIDQIYMEACQIISGSGGWPLNCFLLPDGRPFFAGTYYPPEPAYNRPSWTQVLKNIAHAFESKIEVVEQQARQLMDIIEKSDKNYIKKVEKKPLDNSLAFGDSANNSFLTDDIPDKIFEGLRERFDNEEGGFGGAPKFPGSMSIQYLLDYYYYYRNPDALAHAELSLTKMIQGGIYDQIGGGFARYATDREWLIPHFEKMLYDNALLINVLSDAYKLTKKEIYRETIEETLTFIEREMLAQAPLAHQRGDNSIPPSGGQEGLGLGFGFYSAYDADSEGIEGKFYVWEKSEIEAILGDKAALYCAFYDITEGGNWEHKNILWRHKSYEEFAALKNMSVQDLKNDIKTLNDKLFAIRSLRIKPGLDDKILLSWNALMISAYARAYEALSHSHYLDLVINNIEFILQNFRKKDEKGMYHTFKNGKTQYDAFLEDYALLIEALTDVYCISFNKKYLYLAQEYADYVIEYFIDNTDNLFYFTSENQKDIPLRKKDLYDSALPSANSTMAKNLVRLGIILDNNRYKSLSLGMIEAVVDVVKRYPSSFSKWASVVLSIMKPPTEIAIIGEKAIEKAVEINSIFLPNKIIIASVEEDNTLPLLKGRYTLGETLIYICENYTCRMPVSTIKEMLELI